MTKATMKKAMNNSVINKTNFIFNNQTHFYRGKVRDVYTIGNKTLVMIASDRISAFDCILPKCIPFKGQVLNQIAVEFLNATKHIVPNWLTSAPDPHVSIGKICQPIKIEMVIRGYLAGHAWREYNAGKRILCGVPLPDGLKENDPFPTPIITPSTKADAGHDEDISEEEIIKKGLISSENWEKLCQITRELFNYGTQHANKMNLILVDTKYEFGFYNNDIYLMDEIHTPDSSRYFYKEGYQQRQINGEKQEQLSKEFVRQWLIENGFQGKDGQKMPEMPDDFVNLVSNRYIELYESITGKNFVPRNYQNIENTIEFNIKNAL